MIRSTVEYVTSAGEEEPPNFGCFIEVNRSIESISRSVATEPSGVEPLFGL